MVVDIYGSFVSKNNPFLQVIKQMYASKAIHINLMGPVHTSLLHIQKQKYKKADIALGFGTPREIEGMHNGNYKLKLGYTSWETTKIPYGSYYGFKKSFEQLDLLIVPSLFNIRLFEHLGVKMHVSPLPYDSNIKLHKRSIDRKPYTMLMEGTLTLKSNVGMVISAFLKLYGDNPDYQLILKSELGTLSHIRFPYGNLTVIDKVISHSDYVALLEKADLYLYPMSAESYSTSLINAVASGLPALVADHSNMQRYGSALLTQFEMVPAERYSNKFEDVGNFWKINYEELKEFLKWAPKHREQLDMTSTEIAHNVRARDNVRLFTDDIINIIRKSYDTINST